jgi:hypothetical protein
VGTSLELRCPDFRFCGPDSPQTETKYCVYIQFIES